MKKMIIICFAMLPIVCAAQVKQPTNIYLTVNEIRGNADRNTTVKIDRNVGGVSGRPIISVAVNPHGYFSYVFETPLAVTGGIQPQVIVWAEDDAGAKSATSEPTAKQAEEALREITNGALTLPSTKNNPQIDGGQMASTTFKYKARILNTNFTIPLARFNFVKDNTDSKKGEILLFNSVGAGVGISWGEMEKTTDANGTTINTEFTNTFGIHLGVLFSSGKDGTEQKNIFSPTLSISILDFQLGAGYELGTTIENQKKGFVSLAYAIPLSKLIKGKYYVLAATPGYNSSMPLNKLPKKERERKNKGVFM